MIDLRAQSWMTDGNTIYALYTVAQPNEVLVQEIRHTVATCCDHKVADYLVFLHNQRIRISRTPVIRRVQRLLHLAVEILA